VVAAHASTGEVDPTRGSGPPTGVEGDDAVTINLAPELLRTGEAPRALVPDLSALVAAHRAKSERPPAAPSRDSSDGDSMPTPIAGAPPIPPPISSSELAVFDRLEERGRVPRTLMSAGNEASRAALGLPGATALPDVVLGPNDATIVHPRRASSSTVAAVVVALLLTTLGVAMWWSSRTSAPSAPVAIEVRATTPASTAKPQEPLVLGTETSSTPSASAAAVSSAPPPAQAVSAPPEPPVATPIASPDRTAKPEAPKKPSPSRPTTPSKAATTPDPKPTPKPAPTPTGESLDNPYR
jgi:hypothetical protein